VTHATVPADPALYGLHGRVPGSSCTSPCEPDCTYTCHERHQTPAQRRHDDFYCDQIRLGRDVSEYKPEIRLAWEAENHAARVRAEEGVLRGLREHDGWEPLIEGDSDHFPDRKPWYRGLWRAWMRLRGWDA
jgi:hypothetical protein